MGQEGHKETDEDLIDELPRSFVLCALHQAKIIHERWKFWSGTVPPNVSIRLHRLETLVLANREIQKEKSITEVVEHDQPSIKASPKNCPTEVSFNISSVPLEKMNSSQPFPTEIQGYTSIDKYINKQIEPKQNIIIQGPDIPHISVQKRRGHFLCCY
ncbi:unnamed protein product [Adineta steineri]|uniref:Uncharacterized protein n=1 Tax=Adineta steineri TaxID=433720 RepID=A0A815AGZ6_9BILA|nr:unnamed protein product [Adineta steineri]CAF3843914.1 unnamed protein product [Adineta steineri]